MASLHQFCEENASAITVAQNIDEHRRIKEQDQLARSLVGLAFVVRVSLWRRIFFNHAVDPPASSGWFGSFQAG